MSIGLLISDQIKVSVVTKSSHFVTDEPPPTAIKTRMSAEAFLLCLLLPFPSKMA